MRLLTIGDHLINESMFIGIFDAGEIQDESEDYVGALEARWVEGATVMAQVVGMYRYKTGQDGQDFLLTAQDKALEKIYRFDLFK